MYGVAIAQLQIPQSVSRLKQLGYANAFLLQDIWPLTEVQSQQQISDQQAGAQSFPTPAASIATVQQMIST